MEWIQITKEEYEELLTSRKAFLKVESFWEGDTLKHVYYKR